jgi:DNA invertase Pin-like site-specific DNA recombinase
MVSNAPIRAAQYLRMSTEHQQYSLENQATAIQQYGRSHGFAVVQTYADAARSGLLIRQRAGLQRLLHDVVVGHQPYNAILVYDVSRWGRFQDTDEAAHYEFLCMRAGYPVHYCAETFPNDGTLSSHIMKALKRTMAGEFSRELGVKVYEGQKRLAQMGFKQGGGTGYGLRRVMISADGSRKQTLGKGEYKNISTDRVVLVPGPEEELGVVREIFRLFIRERRSSSWIARELNRRGIEWMGGRQWNHHTIRDMLVSPKYSGCYAWARTSQKLRGPTVRRPVDQWVTKPGALEPIVDSATFEEAQRVIREQTIHRSDEELLNALKELLARKGRLSQKIIDESRAELRAALSTYTKRFGGVRRAYALIGYQQIDDARPATIIAVVLNMSGSNSSCASGDYFPASCVLSAKGGGERNCNCVLARQCRCLLVVRCGSARGRFAGWLNRRRMNLEAPRSSVG